MSETRQSNQRSARRPGGQPLRSAPDHRGRVRWPYGLLLTILGLFASDADIDKAAGVNINLWAGLGMLAFGLLMSPWALLRPLGERAASERRARRARRRRAASTPRRWLTPARHPARVHDERPAGPDDARPQ